MTNGFLYWSQHQYYDYYNYQDDEDFWIKDEELLEEVEFEENDKYEDTLGRNCEENLENSEQSKKMTFKDSCDKAKEKCERVGQDIWICCA